MSEGKSLTDAFKETGQFPFMLTQMVSVGEATGTLDEMLTKLADFYDEEVDASVSSLLSILEPILLIFVGGMVGSLVISMYLPIFSLMQTVLRPDEDPKERHIFWFILIRLIAVTSLLVAVVIIQFSTTDFIPAHPLLLSIVLCLSPFGRSISVSTVSGRTL